MAETADSTTDPLALPPLVEIETDDVSLPLRLTFTTSELAECITAAIVRLCRIKAGQEILAEPVTSKADRDRMIWAAWCAGGVLQRQIGQRFGISAASVNIVIRRFWTAEVLPTLTPEQQYRANTWGHDHRLGMSWYNGQGA